MKRLHILIVLFFLLFDPNNLFGQKHTGKNRLFFSSGAGAVYSFFEYGDPNFPMLYGEYTVDKKTVGRFFDFEIGYQLNRLTSLSLRLSDHKFSKSFNVKETIRNSNYDYTLIGKLYRNQFYWQLLLNKALLSKHNYSFGASSGVLIINDSQQFSAQALGIQGFSNAIASFHEYPSLEFGVPVSLFYERQIKDNVSFGIKAQAYILISVGSFESISLNPYIRVSL